MTDGQDSSVLQRRTHSGDTGPTVVKVESDVSGVSGSVLTASQNTELHFLRSRVRELEREKAELSAENQRLKNMLVHEIPGLLSTMWQTLGQAKSHQSVSMATGSYAPYTHHHHSTNQDEDLSPQDEEVPGGADLGLGRPHGGGSAALQPTDMEELRRSCSESHCTAGLVNGHVSQVEVYPGSGVLCEVRSWQAANQAQSPTAMARTLLMDCHGTETKDCHGTETKDCHGTETKDCHGTETKDCHGTETKDCHGTGTT
ncbi:hypothetical protein D5F01_LYC21470 [Larimichthys crocea]|uniref:Uncharacterized protein n=1 Tax=Larimichthys crocea TaxID=215358 RepID=A0A6G0HPF4_LARCR|nr:hypothetical protein D5F01_LYC21470 [Larimichthys crocea]